MIDFLNIGVLNTFKYLKQSLVYSMGKFTQKKLKALL